MNGAGIEGDTTVPPSPGRRGWLALVAGVNALAAWGGAIALITGMMEFGSAIDDRLPFGSPALAGLALAVVVAIPLTVLAWSAWAGASRTDDLALISGGLLIAWVLVQVVVLRAYSWFQPAYLCIGGYFVAASHRIRLSRRVQGVLLAALGALLAATGIGLLPHLVKTGLSITSAVSLVLIVGGVLAVIAGARSALAGRRLAGRVLGAAASLILVALAVSSISPAVAATNVPATTVTDTPAAFGLDHESVSVRTVDGVELAAWYLEGDNGAGIVMLHGAGSTRSAVLPQAAALVERGYSVLPIDARGHGESDGDAMDFGWFGDADIAAGTDFLASRTEIDTDRIGVVGFSMGGEEAIGATASDPRIRAAVAEGATARRAADKAWLSESYGWRGWVQQRLEAVQYGITDYLTDASPPTPLRSAVIESPGTRYLLITAGEVEDEGHAAAHIGSAANERVDIWNVAGAGHTDGYATHPDEWTRRVVNFLDQNLD